MRTGRRIILLVATVAMSGCGHGPRSVSDPDPADKIPAIEEAVRQRDRSVIPQLIADLNSDDAAVRFYSIDALRSLTGQDCGYRYFAEEDERKAAVERWKKWLEKNPR
jgi:hypothetical protein